MSDPLAPKTLMKYHPQKIEKKWQKEWGKENLYQARDFSKKPKKYLIVEFPYPSGDGLHVGHIRSYTALDILARQKRMEGYNVLYPMGWDAFGLPTENYALKTGIHPIKITRQNIINFKKQMKSLGLSFDWSRETNTTDPNYYKWTQWIFLQFFKRGLAYQAEMPINWCPKCKIGLANEEVIGGKCERCGAQTEIRLKKQWLLKITKYANRLINDLEKENYLEKIKTQQINWIGRSEGTSIKFKIWESISQKGRRTPKFKQYIKVFTTRTDTIFGVTALVLAPEHPLVEKITTPEKKKEVEKYVAASKKKSEFERTQLEKEKTGVFIGAYALNPANNEKVPIWVGDYVVAAYGGGAVMVVPAHDKRDYQFAEKYNLKIKDVVISGHSEGGRQKRPTEESRSKSTGFFTNVQDDKEGRAFVDYGTLINSGQFNGLSSEEAIEKITDWLIKKDAAQKTVQYKLRDWIFSRQHYWGEPIPLVHCEKCGIVAVSEKDLPIKLPYVEKYEPTETGESPLAKIEKWVKTKCLKCQGSAKRETDTMPNWAGSSWYFLRYVDPKNKKVLADFKKLKYWLPVDLYNGGMEHTTLHLLYSRFWHKFLYDLKVVPTAEPYERRVSHGVVLAEDGRKMSKSFDNVINPDEIVRTNGADALRVYEMFMGSFDQTISWSSQGLQGCFRFLKRVWGLKPAASRQPPATSQKDLERLTHQTIKKVSEDLDSLKFNTAVRALMILANALGESKEIPDRYYKLFLILLSPFAPHLSEELWEKLGNKKSIFLEPWPKYDSKIITKETFSLIIQINGRVRDKIETPKNISEKEAKELALARPKIQKWLAGQKPKKVIYIPGRLLNLVV